MASKKKLYLVQRLAWCPVYNEDFGNARCVQHESVEGYPVRAFDTKAEATRLCSMKNSSFFASSSGAFAPASFAFSTTSAAGFVPSSGRFT